MLAVFRIGNGGATTGSIDFFTARDFVQLQLRLYLNREGALTTSRGFFYVL